ncbi:cyclic nucleotide-binding domain-containing protein [Parachitinimonas caeni]|uniref:Cyclic nucleotide-binding domain-containing protein n=1 Tax=Parachitinimonas caeni TaxID=3031301 RepID=A0ABT7E1V6_9NEIS|nr:cyclic nucleotide-binding domain-containing protein [Parachitinimonas caeni]MDK2126288.1 cyclic nucleotide-binding domain-containing protein [Parachitinimonas caeni]
MPNDELVRRLANSVRLFAEFTADEIRQVLNYCKRASFDIGDYIVHQGEPGRSMYVLLAGQVEVVRMIGDHEQVLSKLGPGDSFGELALLDYSERTASVRCLAPTVMLTFERKALYQLPFVAPKLYRNMALLMASRLRETDELVTELVERLDQAPDLAHRATKAKRFIIG